MAGVVDSNPEQYRLDDGVMNTLAVGKVFRDNDKRVNGMDYTPDGKYLITSSDGGTINLYELDTPSRTKVLHSHKYGIDLVKFVHSGTHSAICASKNEWDQSMRYWDLYENKFLRYFKGHTSPVVNLEVHPYEDIFISSGADNLILLWDLRKDHAIAKIPTTASPFATFDNQGLIFAASAGKQKVHLFDTKNFDKGEFASFKLSSHINDPSAKVTSLKFSPCGKSLLVSTNKGQMFSVDSFSGEVVARYAEMENVCGTLLNSESMAPISPSFTPDSQYVICGAPDGNVYVWNAFASDGKTDCRLVTKLEGHTAYPRFARFSPTLLVLASACKDLALWIPRMPGGA